MLDLNAKEAEKPRFIQLLLEERVRLLREVSRIDRLVKQEGYDPHQISEGLDEQWTETGKPRNSMTKLQAMDSVLRKAKKPLTPRELVLEMKREGYVFNSVNPANTLNPLLYGKNRRLAFLVKLQKGFVHAARMAEFTKCAAAPPPLDSLKD